MNLTNEEHKVELAKQAGPQLLEALKLCSRLILDLYINNKSAIFSQPVVDAYSAAESAIRLAETGTTAGSTYLGLAKADDPIYKEGWQVHLPKLGQRSSEPSAPTQPKPIVECGLAHEVAREQPKTKRQRKEQP